MQLEPVPERSAKEKQQGHGAGSEGIDTGGLQAGKGGQAQKAAASESLPVSAQVDRST